MQRRNICPLRSLLLFFLFPASLLCRPPLPLLFLRPLPWLPLLCQLLPGLLLTRLGGRLTSGLVLKLGREQVNERLATFLSVYEGTVAPVSTRLDYVDLRYPNGFAVRISDVRDTARERRGDGRPSLRGVEPKPVERRS